LAHESWEERNAIGKIAVNVSCLNLVRNKTHSKKYPYPLLQTDIHPSGKSLYGTCGIKYSGRGGLWNIQCRSRAYGNNELFEQRDEQFNQQVY
jgi:hypothetical protein